MQHTRIRLLCQLAFGLCLCIGASFLSCKKAEPFNRCKNITCTNNHVCDTGKCNCPTGFYGTNCEKAYTTTKYLGLIGKTRSYHSYQYTAGHVWREDDAVIPCRVLQDTLIALTLPSSMDTLRLSEWPGHDSILYFTHSIRYSPSTYRYTDVYYYTYNDSMVINIIRGSAGGYFTQVYYPY